MGDSCLYWKCHYKPDRQWCRRRGCQWRWRGRRRRGRGWSRCCCSSQGAAAAGCSASTSGGFRDGRWWKIILKDLGVWTWKGLLVCTLEIHTAVWWHMWLVTCEDGGQTPVLWGPVRGRCKSWRESQWEPAGSGSSQKPAAMRQFWKQLQFNCNKG